MFFKIFTRKKKELTLNRRIEKLKQKKIPHHVAIIMDGNGRWAKKRSLPRVAGHHEGMKVVRKIAIVANDLGIKALTLYAFSTENWKRPKSEVDYLMKLPEEFLDTYLPELIEKNVKISMIGKREGLPDHTLRAVDYAIRATAKNTGLVLNFALNYGGRAEILAAVKDVVADVKHGIINENDLSEQTFANYLMTKDFIDPDLLIRTSGEIRLSNFMLWQLAYTEFWFTECLWPDFNEFIFLDAIEHYQNRSRRFGGI